MTVVPELNGAEEMKIIARLDGFRENDFKVRLNFVLKSDIRGFYIEINLTI